MAAVLRQSSNKGVTLFVPVILAPHRGSEGRQYASQRIDLDTLGLTCDVRIGRREPGKAKTGEEFEVIHDLSDSF